MCWISIFAAGKIHPGQYLALGLNSSVATRGPDAKEGLGRLVAGAIKNLYQSRCTFLRMSTSGRIDPDSESIWEGSADGTLLKALLTTTKGYTSTEFGVYKCFITLPSRHIEQL